MAAPSLKDPMQQEILAAMDRVLVHELRWPCGQSPLHQDMDPLVQFITLSGETPREYQSYSAQVSL